MSGAQNILKLTEKAEQCDNPSHIVFQCRSSSFHIFQCHHRHAHLLQAFMTLLYTNHPVQIRWSAARNLLSFPLSESHVIWDFWGMNFLSVGDLLRTDLILNRRPKISSWGLLSVQCGICCFMCHTCKRAWEM
jgi:hypothetical protein